MQAVLKGLVLLIALEHLFILWIEMFAWTTKGLNIVKDATPSFMEQTKSMAANQGLYNGFLAVGLIWSLFITDIVWSYNVAFFFLGCVIVAGIFGALSASKSIFFKQALPAIFVAVMLFIFK
ncbi:DUF1304 domain-containing protein [Fusibacter ferrireducens]|uniref:DUF1304 domain-containing protein n=1 Tax=Fusibacter ferrireducens TaxID=2785058 RepID=A0ABR9ZPJ3_9FIRM|nr:DUF1304 domain-containing protein [Fusibacter ferrireducens]MBF4692380.1 DUF1304 domain-containing protein [Fusibacter ferrireducens]